MLFAGLDGCRFSVGREEVIQVLIGLNLCLGYRFGQDQSGAVWEEAALDR